MLRSDTLSELQDRIKPEELAKHGFPRPKGVLLFKDTDSGGDEAFYVYLVFPNKTPDEDLAWKRIEPMVSWVRDLIWTETGAELYPYVMVKRQKQLPGGLSRLLVTGAVGRRPVKRQQELPGGLA